MRLYDLATVIRSKNAGPFTLTIDVMFDSDAVLRRVTRAAGLQPATIAALYGVPVTDVRVHVFEQVRTIKVSMPRRVGSGAAADTDVYGSQQHFPLGNVEVP